MISKKHSNSILLALLSQHSAASGMASQEVIESAAASFHLGHKPNYNTPHGKECFFPPRRSKAFNRRLQLGGKGRKKSTFKPDIGILSLSIPSQKEFHSSDIRKSRYQKYGSVDNAVVVDPDVGILSSSKTSYSCPSPHDMCQADSTSSLGGRCVSDERVRSSFHPSIHRKNRLLQSEAPYETDILPTLIPTGSATTSTSVGSSCPETCNDPSFCECFLSEEIDSDECISIMASSCRSGEFAYCIPPQYLDLATFYYCPYYECIDDGKSETACQCEVDIVACEFCRTNFYEDLANCMFNGNAYDAASVCVPADCCASASNDSEREACVADGGSSGYSATNDMTSPISPPTQFPTLGTPASILSVSCPDTCTNPSLCACLNEDTEDGSSPECISIFAESCRSGENADCVPPQYWELSAYYYCPYFECIDEGRSEATCECETVTAACQFCRDNFADSTNCMFGNSLYDTTDICGPADCCANATNDAERQFCVDGEFGQNGGSPIDQGITLPTSPPTRFPTIIPPSTSIPQETDESCPSTCDDSVFCECIFGDGYEDGLNCASAIASSCRRGDQMDCFLPQYEIVARYYYCPFWECLDSGDTIDSGNCQCAAFAGLCEFCTNNFSGDMLNCETGHPYDAYYDGYSVCAIADCCSNSATASEKSSCILRNNATDATNTTEDYEVIVGNNDATNTTKDYEVIVGNNETNSKNEADSEIPLPDDIAKNETEKPPDDIDKNVAAGATESEGSIKSDGSIESEESTEKNDANGAAKTTDPTEPSVPSSGSMTSSNARFTLLQSCALLGVLCAFARNYL